MDLMANSVGFQEEEFGCIIYKRKRGHHHGKAIKKINPLVYRIQRSSKSKIKVVHMDRSDQKCT